ncbi:MAG: DUF2889 domain-containing protein [Syntrophales bacterium]
MKKKELIHERAASVKIYEIGEDRILIEGALTDERLCRSFIYTLQRLVNPGIVHHIIVRLVLSLPRLIIESAEAEMPSVPADMCREMEEVVEKLVGLRLTRGFKDRLNEILGGRNGCIHMNNLIQFMSTAAVQGSYTYYNRLREDGRLKQPDFDSSLIVNSCYIWRDDGPFAPRLAQLKEAARDVKAAGKAE